MDAQEAVVEEKADYTLFILIYGFIALLAICVLFSLGKALYEFYSERAQIPVAHAIENNESNIISERQSVPNIPSISHREEIQENNGSDSDRLHTQLDKLRKLLNRLNAMGTFSRDTIGDLSEQSTCYGNQSLAASSNLSNFWSSIDFDDFEESTIIEDNLGQTPREKSVSMSVSDFSLDTSGIQYGTLYTKSIAPSSKTFTSNMVSSMLTRQTNPSDAIDQILAILDSIMIKNKNDAESEKNNTLKPEKKLDDSVNIQILQPSLRSKYSEESFASQQASIPSTSSVYLDNEVRESLISESIKIPGYKQSKIPSAKFESADTELPPKPKFLEVINSQYEMHSSTIIQPDISRKIDVANEITSTDESKPFPANRLCLFVSNDTKIAVTPIASMCVEPIMSSAQPNKHSESFSMSMISREFNLQQDEMPPKMSSETNVKSRNFNLGVTRRSHSLSNLLDKSLILPSLQPQFIKSGSFEEQSELSNSKSEKKPDTVINVSEVSKCHSRISNKMLFSKAEKCENKLKLINNRNFTSVSAKELHLPLLLDTVALKSSISESEIKETSCTETFSPNISSSGSVSFMSPITISDLSPVEKLDWKSPVEQGSGTSLSSNRIQHNEYSLSRSTCIWSTPPSPQRRASDEAI